MSQLAYRVHQHHPHAHAHPRALAHPYHHHRIHADVQKLTSSLHGYAEAFYMVSKRVRTQHAHVCAYRTWHGANSRARIPHAIPNTESRTLDEPRLCPVMEFNAAASCAWCVRQRVDLHQHAITHCWCAAVICSCEWRLQMQQFGSLRVCPNGICSSYRGVCQGLR